MNIPINIAFFEVRKKEPVTIWRRVWCVPRIGETVKINEKFEMVREVCWNGPYSVEITLEP